MSSTGDESTTALIRVVFADDSAAIRTLARYSLSATHGFTVVAEAADGPEAIALVARHQPDCVVLDVQMPKMDGFDALDVLRTRFPAIPVIMMSGYATAAASERALAAGAVAYLDKATHLAHLAETVRRVTAGRGDGDSEAPVHAPIAAPVPTVRLVSAASTSAAVLDPPARKRSVADDLRRFEYVVSHDLAEPLRIMDGFATLLATRYASSLDESGQVFLGHIVAGAARMQAMIDDLLTYGRAGKATPCLQTVDLSQAVRRAYDSFSDAFERDGVAATTGELPNVVADPGMLDTVLRAVVLNAITFTNAAVPTVHIEARVVGALATIEVHDNGVGILPTDYERVFELFQRLHTREEYPGTGTGLALVRRLLDLQGGAIGLGASPRGGTVVSVTLPAA